MTADRQLRWRRINALVLAVLLAVGAVAFDASVAAQAQSSSSELQKARADRDRLQRELDEALGGVTQERNELLDIRARLDKALGQLRVEEGQLALAEDALATAELMVDVAEQELAIATRLLGDAESELAEKEEEFTNQIVIAYKYGAAARGQMVVTMLTSSTSPGDLSRNLYRIGAVIEHQDSVIDVVALLRDEQAAAAAEAEAARTIASDSKAAAEVELAFVADRREAAAALKDQVAREEASQKRLLDNAAGDANGIATRLAAAEAKVKKLEAEQRRVQAAARGGVLCPIDPVWFSNDWGYPRSGGRTHKGTDMFADVGTPIVAIAAGTIRKLDSTNTYVPGSNRGDLGGISISYWVDSNEYWYFAHLDSLAPGLREGQSISAGQLVGYVGNTGNAYSTPPHSHVGRYVNGSPINPFPTMDLACN